MTPDDMPKEVGMNEAKAHFARLLDEVAAGAEVVITRTGNPFARLVPLEGTRLARKPGYLKGRIRIADDFDVPLPVELLKAFEARKSRWRSGSR